MAAAKTTETKDERPKVLDGGWRFSQKLTLTETARIFGVGESTVRRWIRTQSFPTQLTLGNKHRVCPYVLRAYLERRGKDIPPELDALTRSAAGDARTRLYRALRRGDMDTARGCLRAIEEDTVGR